MAYTINKTDGSILTELLDSSIDQTSTDLTLLGKNVSNYGESFNENLVHLLENFANTSAPTYPLVGQLWYDTGDNRLKVYDGSGFRTSGGPIVSSATPENFIQGDLWINNQTNQLWFYDGSDLLLAGPIYTDEQGLSGPEVVSILDAAGNLKVIVKMWVSSVLMGIWSKEAFTPKTAIEGFTGDINVGFNASTLVDFKFNATASAAETLLSPTGAVKNTNSFVSTEATGGNTSMAATLTIQNSRPLIVGPNQNNEINVSASSFQLSSNSSKQSYRIKVKNASVISEAISVVPDNSTTDWYVGIFNAIPTATLDVGGTMKVTDLAILDSAEISDLSTNRVVYTGTNGRLLSSGNLGFNGSTLTVTGTLAVVGNQTVTGNITLSNGNIRPKWQLKSIAYDAVSGDRLIIDTSGGSVTITLPATPAVGDYVMFIDASNTFDTNSLIIARNGSKINSLSSDLTVSTEGAAFELVYTGSTRGWVYNYVPV